MASSGVPAAVDASAAESSRAARRAVREALGAIDAGALPAVGEGLAAVADLLHANGTLRNAVADPTTPAPAKAALLQRLFGERIDAAALDLLRVAGAQRWNVTRDLVAALDDASTEAVLAGAEADGTLSDVEDELFRFGRILAREPELDLALTDPALPTEAKVRLVGGLLEGKATPSTITIVRRLISAPRGVPLERALSDVAMLASARRRQLLATVRSAVALDDDRINRLEAALGRLYGRDIHVQVEVDPAIIGGLTVRVGDEVVDGSIRHRLTEARARFTH